MENLAGVAAVRRPKHFPPEKQGAPGEKGKDMRDVGVASKRQKPKGKIKTTGHALARDGE